MTRTLALTLLFAAVLALTAGTSPAPLAPAAGETVHAAVVAAGPMTQLSAPPADVSSFDDVLAASCQPNQCYLTCVSKGYWAGYCVGGTCHCQSNPSGRS
ncbi:MAG: hypothetical protein KDD11_12460 [Acidobacteria bacterium]|nr:hypothetical protein [Acidobacteriota bacterium]